MPCLQAVVRVIRPCNPPNLIFLSALACVAGYWPYLELLKLNNMALSIVWRNIRRQMAVQVNLHDHYSLRFWHEKSTKNRAAMVELSPKQHLSGRTTACKRGITWHITAKEYCLI